MDNNNAEKSTLVIDKKTGEILGRVIPLKSKKISPSKNSFVLAGSKA